MSDVEPGSPQAWVLASRPATLSAALVPVAVGTACAASSGGTVWLAAGAALFGACMIQIGTNFANDAFDFEKGTECRGSFSKRGNFNHIRDSRIERLCQKTRAFSVTPA